MEGTCSFGFDQIYSDGDLTRWEMRYDPASDMLLEGTWAGDCVGTFVARRKHPPSAATGKAESAAAIAAAGAR